MRRLAVCAVVLAAAAASATAAAAPARDARETVTPGQICQALRSKVGGLVVGKLLGLLPEDTEAGAAARLVTRAAVSTCSVWMPVAVKAAQELYAHFQHPVAAPSITAPWVTVLSGSTVGFDGGADVLAYWTGADLGSGLARFDETLFGDGRELGSAQVAATDPRVWMHATPGFRYAVQVSAIDRAGATSAARTSVPYTVATFDDSRAQLGPGWGSFAAGDAFADTLTATTLPGATADFRFAAYSIGVVAPVFPGGGTADVYLDGAWAGSLDEAAARLAPRHVVFSSVFATAQPRDLRIVARGGRVDLDAFVLLGPP